MSRAVERLKAEIDEGVQRWIGDENDVSTVTPIAAVRAPVGNVLFPTETQAAAAAVAGFDADRGFVDELHEAVNVGEPKGWNPA